MLVDCSDFGGEEEYHGNTYMEIKQKQCISAVACGSRLTHVKNRMEKYIQTLRHGVKVKKRE